jgi:hypothetical protein
MPDARPTLLVVLATLTLATRPTAAQPAPPPIAPPVPEARAAQLQGALHVDGRLDEPAWAAATPVTSFTQVDPQEGQPVSERTEVRVLVSDEAIYVGARLFDRDAGRIRARLARRDDDVETDEFDVYLDAYHDHLTAVRFRVNPAGAMLDGTIGSNGNEDDSWDAVWEAASTIDSLGWTAEMRIPLSQLRFASSDDATWGVQFARKIFRKGEWAVFAFTPKAEQGGVNRYGNLTGLGRLSRPRRLELTPYVSTRNERLRFPSNDPFRSGSDWFGAAGADVKYGLTSNLTLDLTANPDFGQVEVDPARVNLTAFETFFPEKRPFFVEGADLFAFGRSRAMNNFSVPSLYNSRRIGRAPQLSLGGPGYGDVDAPVTTTIAGAAKLTGRTPGGWAVGALDAVTTDERARYLDGAGLPREREVEPLTHYFAGRVRRELRQGNTAVGAMVTSVNRRLDDPTLEGLLRTDAFAGGVDLAHAWARRQWALDADVTASRVQGTRTAIDLTQRMSDRYLQRPDHAGYFTYDPSRTSLQGYGIDGSVSKNSGKHWMGSLAVVSRSPGFETNDFGFGTRSDYRGLSSIVMYKEDRPGRWFRNWLVFPYFNEMWNFGNDRVYNAQALSANGTFTNFWSANVNLVNNQPVKDDRLTRGGPQGAVPQNGSLDLTLNSDSRKSWSVTADMTHSWNQYGGWGDFPNLTIAFRPTPALRVQFNPSWSASHALGQYVGSFADPAQAATYGRRYVFASLDQRTLEMDTRLDWTMTPRLSLQVFLQPLVVSGRYDEFKELRAPSEFQFDVYGRQRGSVSRPGDGTVTIDPGNGVAFGFPDPDFNYRSLLGNAVLRWEYRSGSTLYLVWQQQRTDVQPFGDFELGRDYRALVDLPPQNVFAAKVTWWVGL